MKTLLLALFAGLLPALAGNAFAQGSGQYISNDLQKLSFEELHAKCENDTTGDALYEMSTRYMMGFRGADKDIQLALIYMNRAADQGHCKALKFAGSYTENGDERDAFYGTPCDFYEKVVLNDCPNRYEHYERYGCEMKHKTYNQLGVPGPE